MPPQCRRPLDRSTRPRQTRARLVHPGPGGRAGRAGDVLAGHPGRTAGHSPGCPRPPLAVGQRPRCCCCGRAWQRSVPAFLPGAGRHRRAAGAVPGVPAPSAAAAAIGSARAAVHPRQCRAPAAHGVADAGDGAAVDPDRRLRGLDGPGLHLDGGRRWHVDHRPGRGADAVRAGARVCRRRGDAR
ncbi:hypothetical protein G6F57_016216 [Rhizopus arrhizus]|nr:hypothetical protein G6F22_012105 [Rhizopus arrhizus]KAG1451249.1 hypothetical protein G6F57_016216 [Rhizopus arrhizus]